MNTVYHTSEEDATAVKHRFESFKLGKSFPSAVPANHTKPAHLRSHSRNTSVSSAAPTNSNRPATDPLPFGTALTKRPNSHHRRRSSVSTRRESAEMMGLAMPDLPVSLSDDNIHMGDKDSVRRRALWALEGKPDVPYSKVEIPELSTLENEKKAFEFPTKPSFPPGPGAGYPIMGKRDSFKLLSSSSSSKDPLHTLVEEEEEEEAEPSLETETTKEVQVLEPVTHDVQPVTPAVQVSKPPPAPSARPRPTHLNLRPLSLTPENLSVKFNEHGLPTPPSTASSLKSAAFNPSGAFKSFLCTNSGDDSATKNITNNMKRPSLTPSPSLSSTTTLSADSPSPTPLEQEKPKRRSSISYKTSHRVHHAAHGIPTPEATPTSDRRQSGFSSISSLDDESSISRPLSASEQHFLFKSHQALLARINDLERGLALRNRPASCTSDSSSQNGSEPTDEMLQLVTDLKAERDELKRDVDGWRTRVTDLENHITIYAKRVEAERRDAWVARSRVTLLDVEKTALEKSLDEKTRECQSAINKCDHFKTECERLRASLESMHVELNKTRELEEECCQLRTSLLRERKQREELQAQLRRMDPLATPTTAAFVTSMPVSAPSGPVRTLKRGLGFESIDSESSTDVESFEDSKTVLTSVVEELDDAFTDEEDELARYEDEDDGDMSFQSGSSFGSMDEIRRPLVVDVQPPSVDRGAFRPSHRSSPSWSKTWTFPKAVPATPGREEVDRFFNCLDDDGQESPPLENVSSYEDSKGFFSKAFMVDAMNDDDLPPFFLPRNVGEEIPDRPSALEVLVEEEEEEEEEEMQQANEQSRVEEAEQDEFSREFEVGGIKITFTPPPSDDNAHEFSFDDSLLNETAPNFDDDTDSFNFGRITSKPELPSVQAVSPDVTKAEVPRHHAITPSSIPRPVLSRSSPTVEPFTPPKSSLTRFIPQSPSPASAMFTPPSKRGGTTPSFIPQPVSSPLRSATPNKQRAHPCATFIPQPPRKSTPDLNSAIHVAGSANGLSSKHQINSSRAPNQPPRLPRRSRN